MKIHKTPLPNFASYNWKIMFIQKDDGLYALDKDGERPATKEEVFKYFGSIEDWDLKEIE